MPSIAMMDSKKKDPMIGKDVYNQAAMDLLEAIKNEDVEMLQRVLKGFITIYNMEKEG